MKSVRKLVIVGGGTADDDCDLIIAYEILDDA